MTQPRPWTILLFLTGLAACARFVSTMESGRYDEVLTPAGASQGVVLLSHNINGETEPCGCNKFPLGGLEQVAGLMHREKSRAPVLYVDTGDTFFPSPTLPEHVHASHRHTADTLASALGQLGLDYYVPGDQDFALGIEWLEQLSSQAPYKFLLANLRPGVTKLKAMPWVKVRMGAKNLVLIGVLDPELLSPPHAAAFTPPAPAIASALKDADPEKEDIVILLSHAGMERDRHFARTFPRLDWVLGAHSQSFTQHTVDEGKTQLAQVLSRNHFLGRLQFGLGRTDRSAAFTLLESREETSQLVSPNPMTPVMQRWRTELKRIQAQEQGGLAAQASADPFPTFNSCVECHKPQTNFWQGTSHALAWQTLEAKGAANDESCVGCHSLGWKHPQGFSATPARVLFSGKADTAKLAAYTQEISRHMHGVKSPRSLPVKERRRLAGAWLATTEKHGVSHEYANVQCLNCHAKDRDHPFDGKPKSDTPDGMAAKCLTCHTADQTPSWYQAGRPHMPTVKARMRDVACPKL